MLSGGLAWWEENGEEQLVWKTENAGGETGDVDAGEDEGEFRFVRLTWNSFCCCCERNHVPVLDVQGSLMFGLGNACYF